MTSPTSIKMRLVPDSGSTHYQDGEDDVTFYVESLCDGDAGDKADAQALDMCPHFFRQHLAKHGYASAKLSRLLRAVSMGDFMKLVTEMHLAQREGPEKASEVTCRLAGTLVSLLQQREKAREHLRTEMEKGENDSGENSQSGRICDDGVRGPVEAEL